MTHTAIRALTDKIFMLLLIGSAQPMAGIQAQSLSGYISGITPAPERLLLKAVFGADEISLDSARIDAKGRFAFPALVRQQGFYKLALNDSDRVDIILDPREREVRVRLDGSPLQEHITILASIENRRMWEYKRASRQAQLEIAGLRDLRDRTERSNTIALNRIDSLEMVIDATRKSTLERLVAEEPMSYFSKIVRADRRLMAAVPLGPQAIAASFDWHDPGMVRSSLYPKAMMAYLQNIPIDVQGGLHSGVDSLMSWAATDSSCWRYARSLLVRLFDQFGPDEVAQYVVDRYVVGPGALMPVEPALQDMLTDRLRMAVGAKAPSLFLHDPIGKDSLLMLELVGKERYTTLFFYSSTCEYCHAEMPGLKRIHADYRDRGMQVLGIALDADLEEFQATIRDREFPWPSFSELTGWGSTVAKALGIKATPALLVLDEQGTMIAKPMDHMALRQLLEELIP